LFPGTALPEVKELDHWTQAAAAALSGDEKKKLLFC
jgi:hypothetical protein